MTPVARPDHPKSLLSTHVGFLERITINKHLDRDDDNECDLEIVLVDKRQPDVKRVRLTFRNVHGFVLGDIAPTVNLQLAIYDQSSWGRETERYRVIDEEEKIVSFNCSDIASG